MNFKTRNTLTVGLTGGILCGKSTALRAWHQASAFVLSCDELVREISARPSVQKKIQVLLGSTDRAAQARQVFTQTQTRRKLEQLLHPLVEKEIACRLKSAKACVRVIEVPLLFEADWQDKFDLTIALVAPQKTLAARAKKRGLTQTDLLKRRKAQFSQEQKAALADICIINDRSTKELVVKVEALQHALSKIYNVK